jgi:hypothetical protein
MFLNKLIILVLYIICLSILYFCPLYNVNSIYNHNSSISSHCLICYCDFDSDLHKRIEYKCPNKCYLSYQIFFDCYCNMTDRSNMFICYGCRSKVDFYMNILNFISESIKSDNLYLKGLIFIILVHDIILVYYICNYLFYSSI